MFSTASKRPGVGKEMGCSCAVRFPFLLERVSVFAHCLPGDEWVLAEISSVFVNYFLKKEVLLLILIISSIHF